MLTQSAHAALWLLIFATPIALYVAWSDLRAMRIPNKSVLALLIVYAIVGVLTLPISVWAWSWLHFVVVLVVGFALSLTGGFGAGDAKFAAAMAPFIALGDLRCSWSCSAPWCWPPLSRIASCGRSRRSAAPPPIGQAGSVVSSRSAWRSVRR